MMKAFCGGANDLCRAEGGHCPMRVRERKGLFSVGRVLFAVVMILAMLTPFVQTFAVPASAEIDTDLSESVSAGEADELSAAAAEPDDASDDELTCSERVAIFLCKLVEDVMLFDLDNTDPARVAAAHYFAGYKGQFLFFGDWFNGRSGSFGLLLGLHDRNKNDSDLRRLEELLKHEHGHYEQYLLIGFVKYLIAIAIPSLLHDPVDYYSQPWEVTADLLGGVISHRHTAGSEEAGIRYLNRLINASAFQVILDFVKG